MHHFINVCIYFNRDDSDHDNNIKYDDNTVYFVDEMGNNELFSTSKSKGKTLLKPSLTGKSISIRDSWCRVLQWRMDPKSKPQGRKINKLYWAYSSWFYLWISAGNGTNAIVKWISGYSRWQWITKVINYNRFSHSNCIYKDKYSERPWICYRWKVLTISISKPLPSKRSK